EAGRALRVHRRCLRAAWLVARPLRWHRCPGDRGGTNERDLLRLRNRTPLLRRHRRPLAGLHRSACRPGDRARRGGGAAMSETHPWDRQPGEPPEWFARFERYRLLGTKRSVETVYEQEPATTKRGKARRPSNHWYAVAGEWNWK